LQAPTYRWLADLKPKWKETSFVTPKNQNLFGKKIKKAREYFGVGVASCSNNLVDGNEHISIYVNFIFCQFGTTLGNSMGF